MSFNEINKYVHMVGVAWVDEPLDLVRLFSHWFFLKRQIVAANVFDKLLFSSNLGEEKT